MAPRVNGGRRRTAAAPKRKSVKSAANKKASGSTMPQLRLNRKQDGSSAVAMGRGKSVITVASDTIGAVCGGARADLNKSLLTMEPWKNLAIKV